MQQNYSYQRTTTQYSSNQQSTGNPPILVNSGLTDRDGAKQVAKRILDTYDRDRNGVIDSIEVVPMIVDAYKSFNRVFSPSRADIESYLKILDRNGDGRVTVQDLEDLCTKYLTQKIWSQISSFLWQIYGTNHWRLRARGKIFYFVVSKFCPPRIWFFPVHSLSSNFLCNLSMIQLCRISLNLFLFYSFCATISSLFSFIYITLQLLLEKDSSLFY